MSPTHVPSYDRRAAVVLRDVPATEYARIDTDGCGATAAEIERLVSRQRPIAPGTLMFDSANGSAATFVVATPDAGVVRGRVVLHAEKATDALVTVWGEVLLEDGSAQRGAEDRPAQQPASSRARPEDRTEPW